VEGIRFVPEKRGSALSEESAQLGSCDVKSDSSIFSGGDENQQYLRLITLNTWYWTLFSAVISVTFLVSDFQANTFLSTSLLRDQDLIKASGQVRYIFPLVWLFFLLISIRSAYREAAMSWAVKTNPSKGDLISNCSRSSQRWTFMAMIAFEFFLLEKDIKDIVINLHPWKGVQDFSAFKCEGHRAFFLGFRSKSMHRAENCLSMWRCLPLHMLSKLVMLIMKLYLISMMFITFKDDPERKYSFTLLASALISFLSCCRNFWQLYVCYQIRARFYRTIVARLQSRDDPEDKQHRADIRLLGMHFRCTWDEKKKRVRSLRWREMRDAESWAGHRAPSSDSFGKVYCKSCGRASNSKTVSKLSNSQHCWHCCHPRRLWGCVLRCIRRAPPDEPLIPFDQVCANDSCGSNPEVQKPAQRDEDQKPTQCSQASSSLDTEQSPNVEDDEEGPSEARVDKDEDCPSVQSSYAPASDQPDATGQPARQQPPDHLEIPKRSQQPTYTNEYGTLGISDESFIVGVNDSARAHHHEIHVDLRHATNKETPQGDDHDNDKQHQLLPHSPELPPSGVEPDSAADTAYAEPLASVSIA
jgi:hypothetical protein